MKKVFDNDNITNQNFWTLLGGHFQTYLHVLDKKKGWHFRNHKIESLNKINNLLPKFLIAGPRKIEYMLIVKVIKSAVKIHFGGG